MTMKEHGCRLANGLPLQFKFKVEISRYDEGFITQTVFAAHILHTKMAETPLEPLHLQTIQLLSTLVTLLLHIHLVDFLEEVIHRS